jgi:Protein kinase domain
VPADLAAGTEIASYTIRSVIGRGGMGVVYLAEHHALGRNVALKVLAPELAGDEEFRQRFLREARLAASIDHPNVIPVYDAGDSDGLLFLAMRHVPGTDLARTLDAEGTLRPARAVKVLSQIAGALDAAHARGLVHRDVKPANILIQLPVDGEPERVYLSDFGLTKRSVSTTSFTKAGYFMGTIHYAAPEQIRGTSLDGRADVYSLCCVLYECLAGQPPYPKESDLHVMAAQLFDPPPRLSERRVDVTPEMDEIMARGMAKDREDRFPTCGALMTAAQAQLSGLERAAQPGRPTQLPQISPFPVSGRAREASTAPAKPRALSTAPPTVREHGLSPAPGSGGRTARRAILAVLILMVLAGVGLAVGIGLGGGGTGGSGSVGWGATPLDSYVTHVRGLLAESKQVRQDLVDAVGSAGTSRAEARDAIPAVQRVLDSRRDMLKAVSALDVPTEAEPANTFLAQAFRDSLNDDVLYLRFVQDLASGDQSAASAVLDNLGQQRQATAAAKEQFIREFNDLLSKTGRPTLPLDYKF